MPKSFPCPYCRGAGEWVESVLDYGEGPRYSCVVCEGKGMIEIGGKIHRHIRQANKDDKAWRKQRVSVNNV